MKKYIVLLLAAFLNITACSKQPLVESLKVTPEMFGAVGDGVTDDYIALKAAFSSPRNLELKAGKVYATSGELYIVTNNKSVIGNGATIKKLNNIKFTLVVDHVSGVSVRGLKLTLAIPINGVANPAEAVDVNAGAHAVMFSTCKDYKIEDCLIDGSWEMGICNMNCIGGYIHNNTIKNCFRDGTYSQYSALMIYESNHYANIKDDAMSMHDYGIDAQKPEIIAAGYPQAGNSKIINNTVDGAVQGISSIGLTHLEISGNTVKNTVNSGINAVTADWEFIGSTVTANNINIHGNVVNYACTPQTFYGNTITDGGQLATGRAAICVMAQGLNYLYTSAIRRLSDIAVTNNTVSYSGANGYFLHNIDRLTFSYNQALNCNRFMNFYTGNIAEIITCNNIITSNNTITDTNDGGIKHILGYNITSSTGVNGTWYITGTTNPNKFSIITSTVFTTH